MLPVRQLSTGPRVLLAFHGIGQDCACFEPLARALDGQYTVYSFDLFFHGLNRTLPDAALTKTRWQQILEEFLAAKGIQRFSVVGFSMGGKFALATAEVLTSRVDELWLLAPDGITVSPYYRLATETAAGRSLFRYFLKHMALFHRLGHFLSSLKLVDRSALRFAESTLSTPEQRERVYNSWIYFRDLRPDLNVLSTTLNHSAIRTRFFFGSFDRVLPVSFTTPLTRHLHSYELTVLKTGHHRLIEKVAAHLGQSTDESVRSPLP
ncbi:alpha/beta fold hydrolase [Tellurirhabdus rosea]|uniref:alpha/beta fold hydrolase n=1 Tax=Tellurirhabdus rosea TaxID=2674997 RepID=UPI002252A6DF|nr:alpha/beta fold hydrolase [Tellurirhabdus rosea]